jgi:proteasome accessory factor C
MILRTPHFQWLARLVLRLGADVRVVGPPELAERVRETAKRALGRYEA